MNRKIVATTGLFFIALMVAFLFTSCASTHSGITSKSKWSGDFAYEIIDNEEGKGVIITGYKGKGMSENVHIPAEIKSIPVIKIGDSAFFEFTIKTLGLGSFNVYAYKLTSVTIPSSVTTIGNNAFRDNYLTSITIPESVTTIGDYAFTDNELTSVTIPSSVTTVGNSAFRDNYLTSITIPESVTTIGAETFRANKLTSAIIPDSVTSIGDYAFADNELTSVIIPSSVTTIGIRAFSDNNLPSVTIPSSVTSVGGGAFRGNKLTGVTIPNSVTSIRPATFANNKLTSVIIPNSVTSIEAYAFENNDLRSVTIPNSVTSIGEQAFANNRLTSVTIPNSVTSIGERAFRENQLTSVTIPNSVTSIESNAFAGNKNITSVTLGKDPSEFVSIFPNLYNFLAFFELGAGAYEIKDDEWFHNGTAVLRARLVCGEGIYIATIDGKRAGSDTRTRHDVYLPPGFHRIEVGYYHEQGRTTTYSRGTVTFEYAFVLESGVYDFTGTIQGDQILFSYSKRN